MTITDKYKRTLEYFSKNRPEVKTELNYSDPYELIVAVILSAQCTDKRVNLITPALFERFPDAFEMAKADPSDILQYISSCTYPNSKARNLLGMAKMLVNEFNGEMPSDPAILQRLPGVGRKTANVIASVLFNKPVIAVDTHVFRVSIRIGLVKNAKSPIDAEKQLMKHIPESLMHNVHHWLILHGRYICKARSPLCGECGLKDICNYYKAVKNKQEH
ncbi:MAG TPA: endonuclease III [Bacteroidales bacterium]|nr:endonuclease III [Bacteroidales bacterium]